jgi:hypothetical protein
MSIEQTITLSDSDMPVLRIEQVEGDLIIQAWAQRQVVAKVDEEEDLTIEQRPDTLVMRCRGDLNLRTPSAAHITIVRVQGDSKIAGVSGPLHIEQIQGDLQLRDGGDTRIDMVHGDLAIRQIAGELTVDTVAGDAAIAGVHGHLLISRVEDDLSLAGIHGSIEATAGDDVSLHLNPRRGERYEIAADGDISCRIPEDTDASISLRAGGDIVIRKLAVAAGEDERSLDFVLGDGGAQLTLQARGDIALAGRPPGWGTTPGFDDLFSSPEMEGEFGLQATEMAEELGRRIEVQIEAATQQIDAKLAEFDGDAFSIRVQDLVQAALHKAEALVAQAVSSAESRRSASERRTPMPPQPPRPARPTAPPVSSEERLAILRMVEEDVITVEQAEALLTALRGKGAK